ncbi:MAG: baseplate J/gp47 family protein [Rhodospirillaceae bacterium]
MSLDRPTLAELIAETESEFDSRLPGADARLPSSNIGVLARVIAGVRHSLLGFIAWLATQLIFDTATGEWLARWASIWGIYRKAASAAIGSVTFTGNDGVVIPAGTVLRRADDTLYTTGAEATIADGAATVAVTASEPGVAGNLAEGGKLSMISPIAGITSTALVAAGGLTGGAEVESDTSLRARFLTRIRRPPHGGASYDYEAWALAVSGVTRAWPYDKMLGGGTVGVAFVCDDNTDSIIPNAATVAAVQAKLDIEHPMGSEPFAFAPAAAVLDITITGLDPATDAVKAAIRAEILDLLVREAEPGGTILISHIREAISLATGENDHAVTVPAADFVPEGKAIAILGTITWA